MDNITKLRTILVNDPCRWRALGAVRSLRLPDCWIGAGFIRNAVWDHLHDRPATTPIGAVPVGAVPAGDVDVIWFDLARIEPSVDMGLEAQLRSLEPRLAWSVKNQARMHIRNGDLPYASCLDALPMARDRYSRRSAAKAGRWL